MCGVGKILGTQISEQQRPQKVDLYEYIFSYIMAKVVRQFSGENIVTIANGIRIPQYPDAKGKKKKTWYMPIQKNNSKWIIDPNLTHETKNQGTDPYNSKRMIHKIKNGYIRIHEKFNLSFAL